MTTQLSRRGFLKTAAAAGAVLYVGVQADGAMAASKSANALLNPFVKIDSDGNVIAIVKHFEMGQGPATGLTTLVAEELGVSMDQISYEFAPSDASVYNNLLFGPFQGTGGSTAMANSWMQYRTAGANAREMLIKAAARDWGIDAAELDIQNGQIIGAGNAAPLGEFVTAAADFAPSETPRLRDPSEWKIIGKASTRRKDSPIKINGEARFAMDV
ncbi:xanthine dehydrogenase family protein molybdopterin-binding subunit, partial [Rhodobacteraceae bacterium R_SAG1]|nr:xanthine dehydrogenase family protein molybdopterin-binding subunit [Rhodobacteraceae bacterium R_SAG1]